MAGKGELGSGVWLIGGLVRLVTICRCSGNHVCIGPRGGRYCVTSGGNKRYGV